MTSKENVSLIISKHIAKDKRYTEYPIDYLQYCNRDNINSKSSTVYWWQSLYKSPHPSTLPMPSYNLLKNTNIKKI